MPATHDHSSSVLLAAAEEAADRIRADGFVAKAINFEGSISLQVQVEADDKRIDWYGHDVHVTPYCAQITHSRVSVRSPCGFSFNNLNGRFYLSHCVRTPLDAAVFAHLMCGPQPVRGPRSMSENALRELGLRLQSEAAAQATIS